MPARRIHNFNAGPSALPLAVLEEAREEFLDFRGSGMSILEVSHRSKWFEEVLDDTIARLKRLLRLDARFEVLFLQGGASLQFAMVPMNIAVSGKPLDYVDTGVWSAKAVEQAKLLGHEVRVVATSADADFSYIPETVPVDGKAAYLHVTSNNTVRGTQWRAFPGAGDVPLVGDMSSDILSREFDPAPFGLIYAGAQKNLGPAGVTLAVIRDDMIPRIPKSVPTMLRYDIYASKKSMYNTPPCFAIYMVGLVARWIEETIGGVAAMERRNREKAAHLYDYLDSQDFYRGTARKDSRSLMNATFRLPTPDLEARFIAEATAAELGGLKGHRLVGGCRASLYNAVSPESVRALVGFMKDFARKNG